MLSIYNAFRVILVASVFRLAVSNVILEPKVRDQDSSSLSRRAVTPNSEGVFGVYWYKWWSDGVGQASYVNEAPGLTR